MGDIPDNPEPVTDRTPAAAETRAIIPLPQPRVNRRGAYFYPYFQRFLGKRRYRRTTRNGRFNRWTSGGLLVALETMQPPRTPMAEARDPLATAHECYFAGDLSAADAHCRQALDVEPRRAAALHLMGLVRNGQNRPAEGETFLRAAIQRNPAQPDYHCHLGQALQDLGLSENAAACFRRAIRLKPDHADALYGLGMVSLDAGDGANAAEHFRAVLAAQPENIAAMIRLSWALHLCGKQGEAEEFARIAIAADPESAKPLVHLAALYRARTRLDEAQQALEQALSIDPSDDEAAENLAHVHHDRSLILLHNGDFERGWKEFEWRRKLPAYPPVSGGFVGSMWDGSDLNGRTIRLHCDQGLGDAIQFIRYAPLVKAKGGRVIIVCHRPLKRLLETVPGVDAASVVGDDLPIADVAIPLMSLPGIFGTRLDTIPAEIPYLAANASDVAAWKQRLSGNPDRKVGIVWAGNPKHAADRARSMPIDCLKALGTLPDVTVYSLQFGPAAEAFSSFTGPKFIDLSGELDDFMHNAAIFSAMDTVISVDTSAVHLAGALGLRVWTLIAASNDWRWLTDREDSPWYPTMRLFRQTKTDDWGDVMKRVVAELQRG